MNYRILIVVDSMIPYAQSWGGSQRMYFLTKYLSAQGKKVSIVAISTGSFNTYGKELPSDVTFVHQPKDPRQVVARPKPGENVIRFTKRGKKIVLSIVRFVASFLNCLMFNELDSLSVFFNGKKCKEAKPVLSEKLRADFFDVVIISGPPFTLFSLVPFVKKISQETKVVMDYRDPWNSWHQGSVFTRTKEKRYQMLSDAVVCTNQALCDDMSEKYDIHTDKYYVSANGFIEDVVTKVSNDIKLPAGIVNFIYSGAISISNYRRGYRDTSLLQKAAIQLKKEGHSNFCFTFVGVLDMDSIAVQKLMREHGDIFRFNGVVSPAEAKKYVYEADVCLVLHTIQDNSGKFLVSGKVYDYIQNRKFMLSVSRMDSLHSRILQKYSIGINVENSVDEIKDAILRCVEMCEAGETCNCYDIVDVESFSRTKQIEKYCSIIERL